jgi:hypothetical protein
MTPLVCFSFILMQYAGGEVITLQKGKEVYCATKRNQPVYLSPPIIEESKDLPRYLKMDTWKDYDWKIINSNQFTEGAVSDKRWEDFKTNRTNYLRFDNAMSVSLSVYSSVEVEIFVNDEEYLDYMKLPLSNERWTHLTIILHNNTVILLKNDVVFKKIIDFKPTEIVFKSMNETYWKIHQYDVMWSDKITTGKATTLTLPAGQTCVMFYVALCKKCILTIPELGRTFKSNNKRGDFFNSWQSYFLEVDGETGISLVKSTTDGVDYGEWEIDIRDCPVIKNNNVIYKKIISGEEETKHTCEILNNQLEMQPKENIEGIDYNIQCDPGKLGEKCDINCETILGPKYTYCQEHIICEGNKWKCPWGFISANITETSCGNGCGMGKWGADCSKACSSECLTCNPINGDCGLPRAVMPLLLFITATILGMIIIYVLVRYKHLKEKSQQPLDVEQSENLN